MVHPTRKPLVVMDISSTGKGGGPFTSTDRIIKSRLNEKYDFKTIVYKTELGRNISLARIIDLRNQLRELKPDIVHFAGLQLAGFHLAVACRMAGISNILVTIHGFSGDALEFHPIKRWLLTNIIEPLTLLSAKKVCGVSNYVVSRHILQRFAHKCCGVIYNLPPDPYQKKDELGIREELGITPEDIVAVSVARITRDKGYHVLGESILRFKSDKKLKFIVVGIGAYLETMKEQLREMEQSGQVFFLGYRSDIQRLLSECNFFILPTLHETLSIALLEAAVEGLALIASDTGGVPEIVKNGYNGLLVPPGDGNQLAEAIDKLYRDSALRQKMGHNARVWVKDCFGQEGIEKRIDQVYRSLLSNT